MNQNTPKDKEEKEAEQLDEGIVATLKMMIDPKFLLFFTYNVSHAFNLALYFSLYIPFFVEILTNDPDMAEYDTDDKKN